jgi:glutamate transport system permease protein
MSAVIDNLGLLGDGLRMTLLLTVVSGLAALALGVLLAAARVSPVPALRLGAASYVNVVRNAPLPVVFFFSAFVLPQIGVKLSYFVLAVLALLVYHAAHFCEAIRSGINAVDVGQAEAARSVGLTFGTSLRLVILPQAARVSIPPLINVAVLLVKNSAIAGAFAVTELVASMERVVEREPSAVIPVLLATGALYLAVTIPAGFLASHVEKKVAFLR